jgi:polyphosphate kinase 2 (PPK2 family)
LQVGKKKAEKNKKNKISNDVYDAELFRLQTELVKLQEWARDTGARIVIVFEGRRSRQRRDDQTDHRVP